jgi:hypothetical protein
MQDDPTFGCLGPWAQDVEQHVLRLLLEAGAVRLWSLEELVREFGDEPSVLVALAALQGAGLVHRSDGFVFASRAAARCSELIGGR